MNPNAAAAGAAAGLMVPGGPTQIATFADYYSDSANDDLQGNYRELMASFGPTSGEQPADLRANACSDARASGTGYLRLEALPGNPAHPGQLVAYHLASQVVRRTGHAPTQWDNRLFMYTGDLVGGAMSATYEFPGDGFVRINNGNDFAIPLLGTALHRYASDPTAVMLGPYNQFDVGAKLASFRNCVPVPFRYMKHFLARPLSVREGLEIVGTAILNDGKDQECEPLVDFLCFAATLAQQGDTYSRARVNAPLVVGVDAILLRRRLELVDHKLPGRMATPIASAGVAVAASIDSLTAEQRRTRQEAAARHAASSVKTVDDYFGANMQSVLRVLHAGSSQNLPPIYQSLADHGRKKTRTTLQTAIDVEFTRRSWHLHYVVPPELAVKIQDWQLRSDMMGMNLSRGIHPLSIQVFTDLTDEKASGDAYNRAARWDSITSGDNAVSLQDSDVLLDNNKVYFPTDLMRLTAQIQIFTVVITVLFGTQHPMTIALEDLGREIMTRWNTITCYQLAGAHKGNDQLVPAVIARKWQLLFSDWVDRQERSPISLPAPDFIQVFNDMRLGNNWEPVIPQRYLKPTTPVTPTIPAGSGGHDPDGPDDGPRRNTQLRNEQYNAEAYQKYLDTGRRMRDVKKKALVDPKIDIPVNDKGKKMCPSWHMVGQCNSACNQSEDHVSKQSEAEVQRLTKWADAVHGRFT